MFDCLATLTHSLRVLVEELLDGFQYILMLPPGNASLRAGGAARLERTVAAGIGPIAPQPLPDRGGIIELVATRMSAF